MRSILAMAAGAAVRPCDTTNTNACRYTFGATSADGVRGPIASTTSLISTSRRVPRKVTPTRGADSDDALVETFTGFST